jgi:allantoin racemase
MNATPTRILVVCPWSPGREAIIDRFSTAQLDGGRWLPDVTFDFRMTKTAPDLWDNHHDLLLADLALVEPALEAQEEGYDAVVLESIGDGGLDELRAVLDIPVVSAGQAAHLLALQLGRRFSVLHIWEGLELIHRRALRMHGWEDRCASIRWLEMTAAELNFADMFGPRRDHVCAALAELGTRCIEEDGADVLLLGSTTLYPAFGYLRDRMPVPVIEPAVAAYKAAESLVALGLTHSRAAYRPATVPLKEMVHAMVDAGRRW